MRRLVVGVLLLVGCFGGLVSQGNAGEYVIRQCAGSGQTDFIGSFQFQGVDRIDVVSGCGTGTAGKIGIYQDRSGSRIPFGVGGQFSWNAPLGVEIVGSEFTARLNDKNGIRARLLAPSGEFGDKQLDEGQPHDGQPRTTRWLDRGRPRHLVVTRLMCELEGGCANVAGGTKAYFEVTDVELAGRDIRSPSVAGGGQLWQWLSENAWRRGSTALTVNASDVGSGVAATYLVVNGLEYERAGASCAGDRGGYASRFNPCPASLARSVAIDTGATPFHDGANQISLCAEDYSTVGEPNSTCSPVKTVFVDNTAPGAPVALESIQGQGWQAENGFELTWREPGLQMSPIVQARYVLARKDGTVVDSGVESVLAAPRLERIRVPGPGEYEIEVRLEDAAGNIGERARTSLRFDDGRPSEVAPEQSGVWLSADDFPTEVVIEKAEPGGPSGVTGYAVDVSKEGPSTPCPSGRCAGDELSLASGPDDRTARIQNLPEGENWVSTVAASGARLPSPSAGYALLKVDKTAPTVEAVGLPEGWVRGPVTVRLQAEDDLSGMHPEDATKGSRPATVFKVGDEPASETPGARASVTLAEHGLNRLRYWARDLAGNSNDGLVATSGVIHQRPGTALVKIDRRAPEIELVAERSAREPELVQAQVGDPDAGLRSAAISYRRVGGSSEFHRLESRLAGGIVTARIPSDDLPPGSYEIRVQAEDRVGNESDTIEDGQTMVLGLPLKDPVSLSSSFAAKGRKAVELRVGYGKRVEIEGRLSHADGTPYAGARVTAVQEFAPGSRRPASTPSAVTDRSGRYRMRLDAGPSRSLRVTFAGTATERRVVGRKLSVIAKDRVAFRIKPRVLRNRSRVRMVGSVRGAGALKPSRGKLVAIQYFDPARTRWRPVEVLRANRRGRFSYGYRFRTIAYPQRIMFRAVSLPERGWPYQPSTSRRRSVIVYPKGSPGR